MVEGGAEEGFAELYRENFRPLFGMATALVGSRVQAEEVVQEAFASAFDRYGHLADPQQAVRRSVLGAARPASLIQTTRIVRRNGS